MKTVKPTAFPHQLQVTSPKELGAALRAARTSAGMPLAAAAQALGMSKQTLSNLELGTGTVGLAVVFQAAKELGVSLFAVAPQATARARRALQELDHGP